MSNRATTSGPAYRGAGDLVEQLGGDGVAVDDAAGAGVLGDDAGAVGGELGEREAGVQQLLDGCSSKKESCRRWPARRTRARARRRRRRPARPGRRGPSRSARCAGPTTSEASVTRPVTTTSAPGPQALGDPEAAEVGVRGQRRAEAEFGGPRQQVVALDVARRRWRRPSRPASSRSAVGQPGRVEPAGVDDDAHAPVGGQAEALLHLRAGTCARSRGRGPSPGPGRGSASSARPGSRRSGRRAARPRASPGRRRPPVAVEARRVADPQRCRRVREPSAAGGPSPGGRRRPARCRASGRRRRRSPAAAGRPGAAPGDPQAEVQRGAGDPLRGVLRPHVHRSPVGRGQLDAERLGRGRQPVLARRRSRGCGRRCARRAAAAGRPTAARRARR